MWLWGWVSDPPLRATLGRIICRFVHPPAPPRALPPDKSRFRSIISDRSPWTSAAAHLRPAQCQPPAARAPDSAGTPVAPLRDPPPPAPHPSRAHNPHSFPQPLLPRQSPARVPVSAGATAPRPARAAPPKHPAASLPDQHHGAAKRYRTRRRPDKHQSRAVRDSFPRNPCGIRRKRWRVLPDSETGRNTNQKPAPRSRGTCRNQNWRRCGSAGASAGSSNPWNGCSRTSSSRIPPPRTHHSRPRLIAKVQSRLVTMMPIRDDQLLIRHRALNPADRRHIRHRPQPVRHPEFVMQFLRRGFLHGFFQQVVNQPRRIVVEHEKLAGLRVRVPQQLDAVRFRRRKRALVPEHHLRVVILHSPQRDKTYARLARVRPRHQIFLRISVNSRRRVLHQNFLGDPLAHL